MWLDRVVIKLKDVSAVYLGVGGGSFPVQNSVGSGAFGLVARVELVDVVASRGERKIDVSLTPLDVLVVQDHETMRSVGGEHDLEGVLELVIVFDGSEVSDSPEGEDECVFEGASRFVSVVKWSEIALNA